MARLPHDSAKWVAASRPSDGATVLKSITIKRFRSIHEQTIAFGHANLFIGSNGAGKSNVLEALGVLGAALSNGIDPVTLDNKGVRLSLPSLFKSAFKNHDLPKTFRIEACSQSFPGVSLRLNPRLPAAIPPG